MGAGPGSDGDAGVGGDQATVRTTLISKQGAEIPIHYRMLRTADRWQVYDVISEGMSFVGNYRAQFDKIIRTSSYQELVRKLKIKQEEVPAEDRLRKS